MPHIGCGTRHICDTSTFRAVGVSPSLYKGQPDPASAWTDDEIRVHLRRQAAEANLDTAGGAGRLVWVYVFNNERYFAHATWVDTILGDGSRRKTTLQRVAIVLLDGKAGPAALQPKHRTQMRRAITTSLGGNLKTTTAST